LARALDLHSRGRGFDSLILHKIYFMNILEMYYITCVVYCFYQLYKRYERVGVEYYGVSPELDTIMVMMMAWVLAPIDVSLTWIRLYKDAEIVRRKIEKIS
jgi:hypothetical protein